MSLAVSTLPRVGDFLASSWGYDQTNVDFYRVLEVTPSGKSVRVQQWSSDVVEDAGPQVYVVPGDGPAVFSSHWDEDGLTRLDEPRTWHGPITLHRWHDGISLSSYGSASPWNGRPMYQTGRGWGH